jgi:hypothetical protein
MGILIAAGIVRCEELHSASRTGVHLDEPRVKVAVEDQVNPRLDHVHGFVELVKGLA